MAFITGTSASSFGLGERFAALRAQIREARKAKAIYRQTRDELMSLSDRDLADLGLHRSQIRAVARQAARMG